MTITRHPSRFNFLALREIKRREREMLDWRRGAIAAIDRRYFPGLPPIVSDQELRDSPTIRKAFEAVKSCPMAINLPYPEHEEYPDGDQYVTAARVCAVLCVLVIGVLWLVSTFSI